jgi:hypothetical protein
LPRIRRPATGRPAHDDVDVPERHANVREGRVQLGFRGVQPNTADEEAQLLRRAVEFHAKYIIMPATPRRSAKPLSSSLGFVGEFTTCATST